MSLETNRADFEKALEEMKGTLELLNHSVDDHIMQTLYAVVNEYEGHLSRDINELEGERDNLQEIVDDHNAD